MRLLAAALLFASVTIGSTTAEAKARYSLLAEPVPALSLLRSSEPLGAVRLAPELDARLARSARDFAHAMAREALPIPFVLDEGGGARGGDAAVALILGIFPGFGLGHLIAGDEGGFFFYLLVDFVVLGALIVVDIALGLYSYAWAAAVLGWLGIHVLQGIDAYRTAGGGRLGAITEPDAHRRYAAAPVSGPILFSF